VLNKIEDSNSKDSRRFRGIPVASNDTVEGRAKNRNLLAHFRQLLLVFRELGKSQFGEEFPKSGLKISTPV
jgi:hypothetical protein